MTLRVLEGESAGRPCRNCGRQVAARAMKRHLKRIRTIRWGPSAQHPQGHETDVLADRSYGASRWCDGTAAGVRAKKEQDDLWEPCSQLSAVWGQVRDLWVRGYPRQASTLARTCVNALRAAGIRPREKKRK